VIPNSPVLEVGSSSPRDWGWSWEAKRVTHLENSRRKTFMLNYLSSPFYHIATSPVAVEPSSLYCDCEHSWHCDHLCLPLQGTQKSCMHSAIFIEYLSCIQHCSRYSGHNSGPNQKKKKKLILVLMELTSILEGWGPKYKVICRFCTVLAGHMCDGEKQSCESRLGRARMWPMVLWSTE